MLPVLLGTFFFWELFSFGNFFSASHDRLKSAQFRGNVDGAIQRLLHHEKSKDNRAVKKREVEAPAET
jgi:hypothetical protein